MRSFAVALAVSISLGPASFKIAHGESAPVPSEAVRAEKDSAEAKLRRVEVGATRPAHQRGEFYLAGQPAKEDLAKWKARGVRTVINLRMPNETDWDERAAVEALGMKYVSVPFAGPATLTDKKIAAALRALRTGRLSDQSKSSESASKEAKATPVLLHCASSNRVGAIWYAHRILHDGLAREAALKEATAAGLRTMDYLDPVEAYIKREKEKSHLPNSSSGSRTELPRRPMSLVNMQPVIG